ncbi:MAG: DUF1697 domain-containing protein [Treponema sp.]|jgi:uncharacterized protein (DUF1697 family)/uncharacterized protein YdhG (YjbR/CyaY superfamily)|nr:DUF1697 domain-containing protein [Treponema sp.]
MPRGAAVSSVSSIDEYIASFSRDIQGILRAVRKTLREAAPGAEEKISWAMPTLYQGENLVHFAAMKSHLGFYPGAEAVAAFAKEIAPYKNSKGAVQFPYDRPVPHGLIARITRWRVKAAAAKRAAKSGTKKTAAKKSAASAGSKKSTGAKKSAVRYLALLRGINVGGQGIIKMADLKAAFAGLGFTGVSTYIASGNVMFSAAGKNKGALVKTLEAALSKQFGLDLKIALLRAEELAAVIADKPPGFGESPDRRWDVMFLRPPLTAKKVFAALSLREGVDEAAAGKGVVYFSRLAARASHSYLSKIAGHPCYREMTIRNWNTAAALGALLAKEPEDRR